jgi:hypothetical protein
LGARCSGHEVRCTFHRAPDTASWPARISPSLIIWGIVVTKLRPNGDKDGASSALLPGQQMSSPMVARAMARTSMHSRSRSRSPRATLGGPLALTPARRPAHPGSPLFAGRSFQRLNSLTPGRGSDLNPAPVRSAVSTHRKSRRNLRSWRMLPARRLPARSGRPNRDCRKRDIRSRPLRNPHFVPRHRKYASTTRLGVQTAIMPSASI